MIDARLFVVIDGDLTQLTNERIETYRHMIGHLSVIEHEI